MKTICKPGTLNCKPCTLCHFHVIFHLLPASPFDSRRFKMAGIELLSFLNSYSCNCYHHYYSSYYYYDHFSLKVQGSGFRHRQTQQCSHFYRVLTFVCRLLWYRSQMSAAGITGPNSLMVVYVDPLGTRRRRITKHECYLLDRTIKDSRMIPQVRVFPT